MNSFNSMHSGININNTDYGIIISNPSTCTINTATDTNGDIYKVYSFTSGTNSMKINLGISTTFYYLCCAGGGVGGNDGGCGGGGGGYLDGTLNIMSDTVSISVGTKGYWTVSTYAAKQSDINEATNSSISGLTFSTISSIKGGAGSGYRLLGSSGGSGGGSQTTTAYAGTSGQGYAGGISQGGGGGAGGGATSTSGGVGKLCGNPGIKLVYPTTKFCAGGGARSDNGGVTGGGYGSTTGKGGNATSWGSGGGGGNVGSGYLGGNGYSGIIVFAYKIS